MSDHLFDKDPLSIDALVQTVRQRKQVELPEWGRENVAQCREFLDEKLTHTNTKYYGVNTGFGDLCNIRISDEELGQLQENLVLSHASGVGGEVPRDLIRMMLLLKVRSLLYGHSGVTVSTVERLLWHYNADVLPVVYEMGSLGASGDLAPLAHLSLPLIGKGKVWYGGEKRTTADILKEKGLEPLRLKAKEGLSLLNGTQFMSAYGAHCIQEGKELLGWANGIGAMAIDGFQAKLEPFHPLIHQARNAWGQERVATHIRNLLDGSELMERPKKQVQDPYAFRCLPQVHGACLEAVEHVESIFEQEINAVTDNPNLFPDEGEILSGGNFHGQRLAMALDYLTIALSEMGSISERRTYKLLSGERGLPAFLVANPGLNSGLMIPQYTAASLCSQNRQLCTPASADSITSSNGQEDHVSMGANAALKTYQVLTNLKYILSIELLTATQALDFRKPEKTGKTLELVKDDYRTQIPFIDEDRQLHPDISETVSFIRENPGYFPLDQKAPI